MKIIDNVTELFGDDLKSEANQGSLRNQMTTRALARECAAWIRSSGSFKANAGAPIRWANICFRRIVRAVGAPKAGHFAS